METKKKYRLTDECITYKGVTVYRIEATKDFGYIKAGTKGGWVESECNLSHDGSCWVCDNAKVFGDARVFGDAWVYGGAKVYDNARVGGDATVYDNARVGGKATVYDNARVGGKATVYDNARVGGDARVFGGAKVCGDATVCGNALVYGYVWVCGCARVCGKANVYGNEYIYGDAIVRNNSDYILFKNWWSSGRYFTWTRSNNMWCVGCFYGTGDELIAKAYQDSELSGREYERVVNYVKSILEET